MSRLISLNLLPISYWFECRDLIFLYKCIHGMYNVNTSSYFSYKAGCTRSAASLTLRPIHSFRTSLFRDSFFNRKVILWNNLPIVARQLTTLSSFKTKLYEHYFNKLNCDFDIDRTRTWKTICPRCRSVNRPHCC